LDRLGLTASAEEPSFDELFAQGTAYVQSGNLRLAVGCFQGAARLDPSHEPTQKLLAKLEGLGMTFEAEADEAKELEAELEEEEEEELELELELSEAVPTTTSKAVTRAETVDERNERVDAALAELGRTGSTEAAATALGPITPTAPSAELRPGALVFVAGGATPLGAEALRAMGQFTPRRVDMALSPAALKAELTDADALVVISEAAGGSGGVAPDKLKLLMAAVPAGITRLLYVGVHGVERTDKLPFSLQNVFGQLDKQRAAEQEVQLRALNKVPSYTLLRLSGKLGGGGPRCEIAPGDALQGEVSAAAAGAVLLESLQRAETVNASLSAGALVADGGSGAATDEAHWDDQFIKLVGPEILRKPLRVLSAADAVEWLREFARSFLNEGKRLTSPIEIEDIEGGATIRFLYRGGSGYSDFDSPETADDRYAASKAATTQSRAKADGALSLVAEELPGSAARVRVSRAEMDDGVVIKEMSETAVLERLAKELDALEKARERR